MQFDPTKAGALVLIAVAFLSAGAAVAQTRLPKDVSKSTDLPTAAAPKALVRNPCSAYGPGFVRVAGSDSCLKVGGSVSVETRGARGR